MTQTIVNIPLLLPRPADSHKGSFGKVLIIGGSIGFSGAPALAGKAALRSGAGLVRIAIPQSILPIVACLDSCYTTIPLAEDADGKISSDAAGLILAHTDENDVVAFGPGAGVGSGIKDILLQLLQIENLKLVIDADGLNTLAQIGRSWIEKKKARLILTPHPGEMARLWKSMFRKKIPQERDIQAIELSELADCVTVLKGNGTVVTDGKNIYRNATGNPGMATAGSGDVLTGMIAALIGQKMSLFDAAVTGVYCHGLAGDITAKKKGQISMIATDIIDNVPGAFMELCK